MKNDIENYNSDYSDIDNNDYSDIDLEDLENRIENLENNQNNSTNYSGAILVYVPGLVLAMILSYTTNQSIPWTIFHGYLSWVYVVYNILF